MKRIIYCAFALAALTSCGLKQQKTVESTEVQKVATTSAIALAEVISVDEIYASEIKAYKEIMVTPAASGEELIKSSLRLVIR